MSCPNIADTSSASLAYGVQSACGTQQTSLNALRFTSHNLNFSDTKTESQEIRPDLSLIHI